MKENRTLRSFRKALAKDFGKDEAEKIMQSAYIGYRELIGKNPDEGKELKKHTTLVIYPAIALAEALQEFGMSRKDAVSWIFTYFEREAEADALSMRIMLKLPLVYRLVPRMFLTVQEKDYGEKAGFESKVIINESDHVVFHMLKCPYNDIFRKYGYPDLTCCLCHQDDVKNGAMHSRLKWSRKDTLGMGGDHCDFSMEVVAGRRKH